jgi:hypothetical protein
MKEILYYSASSGGFLKAKENASWLDVDRGLQISNPIFLSFQLKRKL